MLYDFFYIIIESMLKSRFKSIVQVLQTMFIHAFHKINECAFNK